MGLKKQSPSGCDCEPTCGVCQHEHDQTGVPFEPVHRGPRFIFRKGYLSGCLMLFRETTKKTPHQVLGSPKFERCQHALRIRGAWPANQRAVSPHSSARCFDLASRGRRASMHSRRRRWARNGSGSDCRVAQKHQKEETGWRPRCRIPGNDT